MTAWTQTSIPAVDQPVMENFNTLANSGSSNSTMPASWVFSEVGGDATYAADNGTSSTSNTYSYGATFNTERALGELTTPVVSTFGSNFTNNTGVTITSLLVSYIGEQWRLGATGRVDGLNFQYSLNATSLSTGTWTDVNSLDFVAPIQAGAVGSLDGNLDVNRTPLGSIITGLSISNGSTFWIRWVGFEATGNDDGVAIDDFGITANPTQNYSITTSGNNLIVTDADGNGETLYVSEIGSSMRFFAPGRTYTLNAGPVIALPVSFNIPALTSITINTAAGNDNINIGPFGTTLPSTTINGGTGDDAINFNGDITFTANANLDVDLQDDDASPGIDQVTFGINANVSLSGTGTSEIKVSRSLTFGTGASISTVNGAMTVEANQQGTPTAGTFAGITLPLNSYIQVSGTGILTVKGKGGNSGASQHGISMSGGDIIAGTTGTALITATGGASVGGTHCGINISSSSSVITTNGASLNITATGGPLGTQGNRGVEISLGAITTAVNGSITINASGGASATSGSNDGVRVFNFGDIITNNGNITINGTAGGTGSGSSSNVGVNVSSNASILAGGTGAITLTGFGGQATGVNQYGFQTGTGSSITTAGGNIVINGTGGNNMPGNTAVGVWFAGGTVQSGGTGTITITGEGGDGIGTANNGVNITTNSVISSNNGDIYVTGTGGEVGIGNSYGVNVVAGTINAGGSNDLEIIGTGNLTSGSSTRGVSIGQSTITTGGGTLFVNAVVGNSNGEIAFVIYNNTTMESIGGSILIVTNSAFIGSAISAGSGILHIFPQTTGTQVEVGTSGDPANGPLSLTDAELDSLTAGVLEIGAVNSGTLTVTANITRSIATNVFLTSADNVVISGGSVHTMGGNLYIDPGTTPDACVPILAGTDATCNTMFLTGPLEIDIDGPVADVNYTQFKITGAVNLTGSSLQVSGSYSPPAGTTFTIIDNDGADAVTGVFAGLPQGSTITSFLGSPFPATISYTGGTGNDVVITVASPHYIVTNNAGILSITDIAGNGETLTVSENGANIRFAVPGRTFSLNGNVVANLPVDIPLAGIDSINMNTAAGNDIYNFGGFTALFPNLSMNGGIGDDIVVINGDVSFMTDANLDINFQNDDPAPGTDNITFNPNNNWVLAGEGSAIIKMSKSIAFNNGCSLTTVHGDITLEANQQAPASSGIFYGIVLATAIVEVQESGTLLVKGRGGNTGVAQIGVYLFGNAILKGGTTGLTIIDGRGGASSSNDARGVQVQSGSVISTNGSNISVYGQGSGTGTSAFNYGIMVLSGGQIHAEGMGTVTVEGVGGLPTGIRNHGILVVNPNSAITSSGGDVTVTGIAGGTGTSSYNHGIMVQNNAMISAGGMGDVLVEGTGGFPQGERNDGVICWDSNARITSSGGDVTVNGVAGGSGPSFYNPGVMLDNGGVITAGGSGDVEVNGTGGNGSGDFNYGVYVYLAGSKIISSGTGDVTVNGVGGGNTSSQFNPGVYVYNGGEIIGGTAGEVTVSGSGGSTSGTRNDGVCVQTNNSKIISSGADIVIDGEGQGFGAAFRNYGVFVDINSFISAGASGELVIEGEGATSDGIRNYGVVIAAGSYVSSVNGPISITGYGGGDDLSSNNYGVYLTDGDILTTGTGIIDIDGTGGDAEGSSNIGVYVLGSTSSITTLNASINILGEGGGDNPGTGNHGMLNEGTVSAGGSGIININATGGSVTGGNNYGFAGSGAGSMVTTAQGNIIINGYGGGTGSSNANVGVYLAGGAKIISGGTGINTINGTGGNTSGGSNMGFYVDGINTLISSTGGNVYVTGEGGGALGNGFNNYGISLLNFGVISAGNAGDVFIDATGGPSAGSNNYGLVVYANGSILSNSDINVVATGGGVGAGNSQLGVHLQSQGKIIATGTGTVNVEGTGGITSGGGNHGILIWHAGTIIASTEGNVILNGDANGTGSSFNSIGVYIFDGTLHGEEVDVTGIGGPGTGAFNYGITIFNPAANVYSTGGDISLTGFEGGGPSGTGIVHLANGIVTTAGDGGDITFTANSIRIEALVTTSNTDNVILKPLTPGVEMEVDTFTQDIIGGPVRLRDNELDSIFTGTLILGNITTGDIKIQSDLTRTNATHLQFISAQDVIIEDGVINANGGNVLLDPGPAPAAVLPPNYGQDVICDNLDFGSDLKFIINGNVPDTGYSRLHVEGTIDIDGVNLVLQGIYAAAFPDSFVIILNDNVDAINGIFIGLNEGDTIYNFIVNDVDGVITYEGGDGNDVVIRIVNGCPQPDVPVIEASEEVICVGESVTLTIVDGDLNGATTWHWYSAGCGITPVGTGLSIIVSPSDTTTYYVRGEGGCVTNATCGTKLITVNPHPDPSIQRTFSSPCYYTDNTFQPLASPIPGAVYSWNFGANANPSSANGYGPHVVQYTAAGLKNVKLVIHPNGAGTQCADSSVLMFTIDNCPGQILGRVVDSLDNPIINVNVKLFVDADANGIPDSIGPIRNVFTGSQGTFNMASLIPRSYLILQTQPNNWVSFDDGDLTPDGDLLANVDSLDNLIPASITINKIDSNNVFVEIPSPGSIIGNVFDDLNLNGFPDPGEGINNALIKLFADANANGVADSPIPIATTTSTTSGVYTFLNQAIGNYVLVETNPIGFISIQDIDPSADGDVVPNTNMNNDTIPLTLTSNESDADNFFIDGPTCNLTVTNANDAGPGSYRNAVNCAMDGDTILFSQAMAGQNIFITSDIIQYNQQIVVLCDVSPRIIISSDIDGMFHVLEDGNVEFINLNMVSGFGPPGIGAAFENQGILTLNNVQILRNSFLPPGAHLIKNLVGSELNLIGETYLDFD